MCSLPQSCRLASKHTVSSLATDRPGSFHREPVYKNMPKSLRCKPQIRQYEVESCLGDCGNKNRSELTRLVNPRNLRSNKSQEISHAANETYSMQMCGSRFRKYLARIICENETINSWILIATFER